MDILKSLNNAVSYIENNLTEKITLSSVSAVSSMSEYEFANLFHSLTNLTVKDYIRKRRLSEATLEIQNTDKKIIDIGTLYLYDNADTFRRAFISQHKISPTKARNKNNALHIYPPAIFNVKVEGAKDMNFKIVETKEIEVFGISKEYLGGNETKYDFEYEM